MIRVGIVGLNFGRNVLLPAFRVDRRCEVAGITGWNMVGRQCVVGDPPHYPDAAAMIGDPSIDALAIAVPPHDQPDIATVAMRHGKHVMLEKPMGGDRQQTAMMVKHSASVVSVVDFTFTEIEAFQHAKAMISHGEIGPLRSVHVNWHMENRATRDLHSPLTWKNVTAEGGGALGNFGSHVLHYVEWMCDRIVGMSARIGSLPDCPGVHTIAFISARLDRGAMCLISISCGAFRGAGHRIEIYGKEGTIVLENTWPDHMRGFVIRWATRSRPVFESKQWDGLYYDPMLPDGRIAPVSRIVNQFLGAIEMNRNAGPGEKSCIVPWLQMEDGHRVQCLIDTARASSTNGRWMEPIE